jgi:hypothetical protein
MNVKRTLSPLIAMAVVAVLSACGSSGPSKKDFISRADAICARGDSQIKSVPLPQTTGLSAPQIYANLGSYVDRLLPVAQKVIVQIKALKQPSDNQALLHRYYASLDSGIVKLQALSTAAKQANKQGLQTAITGLRDTQPAQLARQYGFRTCGSTAATG